MISKKNFGLANIVILILIGITATTIVLGQSNILGFQNLNITGNLTVGDALRVAGAINITTGLDGYATSFTVGETDITSTSITIQDGVQANTSNALADGNNWYFNLKSVDNQANWDANADTAHYGPFFIDTVILVSTITVPANSSWQSSDFTVTVTDVDDTSGPDICSYSVESYDGSWTTTVNTTRTCNSDITIGVGASSNCTDLGNDVCRIRVWSNDSSDYDSNIDEIVANIGWCQTLSGNTFTIKTASGTNCLKLDENGDGKLGGTISESCTATPESGSFIIKDSTNINLWIGKTDCEMCIRGNFYSEQSSITRSGTGNYYITNSTGGVLMKVEQSTGDVYVQGSIGVNCTV